MSITSPSRPECHPSGTGPISESAKRVGRVIEDLLGHEGEGRSASSFGLYRLEVHEPRTKDRPRQPLKCPSRPLVLFDLVVKRAEDATYSALLVKRREGHLERFDGVYGDTFAARKCPSFGRLRDS